jgi:hypothetical protein
MNKYLMNDKNGEPSLTRTCFALGFVICTLKLLVSGATIGTIQLDVFSGVDYGAALAALGGIYHLQKTLDNKDKSNV